MSEAEKHPLEPPPIRSAFHAKGVAPYASVEARRQYARSLLRVSEKLFWAPLVALIATGTSISMEQLSLLWVLAACMFFGATYGRPYAMVILDSIPEKANGSKGSRKRPHPAEADLKVKETEPVRSV